MFCIDCYFHSLYKTQKNHFNFYIYSFSESKI